MPDETQNNEDSNQKTDEDLQAVNPLTYFCFGLCMGCADAVPGVSGGTIALILGYYDKFIDALAQVLSIAKAPFKAETWIRSVSAFKLLIPLAIGAISALYVATKVLVGKSAEIGDLSQKSSEEIKQLLMDNPAEGLLLNPASAPYIFALFFGLVAYSIPQPWNTIRERKLGIDIVLAVSAACLVAAVSLLNPASLGINPFMIMAAGALAISVMLLPGISGSLVLLVIGMYQPISQAVHNKSLDILGFFFLGMLIGIACFVPLLKFILHKYHDRTMALLSGLMLGSLVALWPWKSHYMPKMIDYIGPMYPYLPQNAIEIAYVIASILLGALMIYGMQRVASRMQQ